MTVSLAIMHSAFSKHRQGLLAKLLERLTCEGLPEQLTIHSDASHSKFPWTQAKAGWYAGLEGGASHHCLIQDDVLTCADFVATLERMAEVLPDQVISLYCPRKLAREAYDRGERWALVKDGSWGQGIMMPRNLLLEFLEWEQANIYPECPHDDSRVAMWLIETNRPAWVCVPSLVQHLAPTNSEMGYNMSGKVATVFSGSISGLAWHWEDTQEHRYHTGASMARYFELFRRPKQ